MRKHIVFATLVLVTAAASPPLAKDTISGLSITCDRPAGYRNVVNRSDLPPALARKFHDVVMPGKYWDAGDDISAGEAHSGFFFIWNKDRRWIMAYGTGGITIQSKVAGYDIGAKDELLLLRGAGEGKVCNVARRFAR